MVNRLREIRIKLQLTQQAMSQYLGIGKSALSMIETGKASLSQRNKNILVQKLNVNSHWLDTGEGEMFSSSIPLLESDVKSKDNPQRIPLYNIEPNFGLYNLLKRSKSIPTTAYLQMPHIAKCDGAIYYSGEIIIYKKISSFDDIFWGEEYLLSLDVNGEEYVTVRKMQKSKDEHYVKLISDNSAFDDKEVNVKKIKAMALVRASVNIR